MTNTKGSKLKPKFGLNMPFGEALEKFIRTNPDEVEELIKRGKQKKPPGSKRKRKPPDGTIQSDSVVSLRHRRMRKRNEGR